MKKNDKKPPGKNHWSSPKTVGIIFSDVKKEYFPTEAQYLTEKDAYHDALVISKYLQKMGIKTFLFPANKTLPEKIKKANPQVAINLVGSVRGNEYLASTIPALPRAFRNPLYRGGNFR